MAGLAFELNPLFAAVAISGKIATLLRVELL